MQFNNPAFEIGESEGQTGIVSVYQRVRDISGGFIRSLIERILDNYEIELDSALPNSIRTRFNLIHPSEALRRIHRPPEDASVEVLNHAADPAHKSLVFEEFFLFQAGIALRSRGKEGGEPGIRFKTSDDIRAVMKQMLPFRLTEGQRKALRELVDDMTSGRAMRRLLQGDVGCGKTIVALLAAALAIENGYQVAFMAPTEILAEQHYAGIRRHLDHTEYRIGFLTGSLSLKEREVLHHHIADGSIDLIIGTHALIQENVEYHKLGLAIIDEQHRFGVLQRARLQNLSKGLNPHVLIMTATPIPRSLTLTLFGDLNVSVIRDMPPGRKPVATAVRTDRNRNKINRFLEEQMKAGRQIFCVAPVIDESRDGELKTATEMHERLSKTFPNRHVGLLHGRKDSKERTKTMEEFVEGAVDILACTTVIEVGVDVANATVMLVENAERFGLSQLHQLRGRVGRGGHKSYCILMYTPTRSDNARKRLDVMVRTNDGFKIAEKDLEIRGPGDFFGTRQSGMPSLRVGNIIRDVEVLQLARRVAFDYIANDDPAISAEKGNVIAAIERYWQRRYGLVLVG